MDVVTWGAYDVHCLESMAMSVLIKKIQHKLFLGPAASCLGTDYISIDKFSFVPNHSDCIQIASEEESLVHAKHQTVPGLFLRVLADESKIISGAMLRI